MLTKERMKRIKDRLDLSRAIGIEQDVHLARQAFIEFREYVSELYDEVISLQKINMSFMDGVWPEDEKKNLQIPKKPKRPPVWRISEADDKKKATE